MWEIRTQKIVAKLPGHTATVVSDCTGDSIKILVMPHGHQKCSRVCTKQQISPIPLKLVAAASELILRGRIIIIIIA